MAFYGFLPCRISMATPCFVWREAHRTNARQHRTRADRLDMSVKYQSVHVTSELYRASIALFKLP
jgi:hypothetical protein